MLNVQFLDSTDTVIVAYFGGPQNASVYPNQGTVAASDARWAAFYATLPALAQASLPAPTTPVAPPLAQQAAALIAGGITITSAGTAALNGVYTVQSGVPFGQEQIANEAQFISTYGEFTNGATTNLSWPLATTATGVVTFVTFPTTAEFLAFAKVVAQFVAAVTLAVGQGAALPVATATIL